MYSLDYELSNQSYKYRWTISFTISTHPDKTSMADDCVFCTCNVRPRQEALCCDECGRWQHRTCETGISRAEYRALVKTKEDFAFVCSTCKSNTAEVLQSTAMETSTTPTRLVIPPMEITQVETETETETYRPPEMLDSFDIPHRHAADEDEEPMEEALETTENETFVQDEAVTYDILEKGSKRGCPLLVSSDGFTYNLKKQTKDSTIWRCSVRSAKLKCYATVIQRGNSFQAGSSGHCHGGDIKKPVLKKASALAKDTASAQVFCHARDISESAVATTVQKEVLFLAPKISNLKRYVNRHRASFRPKEPTDLTFSLDMEFLQCPDFLLADIQDSTFRHIVFASETQLDILRQAKRWFIDGTFKIVPAFLKPCGQLMSIHAFVVKEGKSMQFPLLFALMSRRRKEDYIAVFTAIKERMGTLAVEMITADFEAGVWQAAREIFPQVVLKGCVFHWTKAVWTKVQNLGLATVFREREGTHKFIKQLLALPFLPSSHIRDVFNALQERGPPHLQDLLGYIENQWLENDVFPIRSWSVFQFTVRTNNDVEGWHRRMNVKAQGLSLPLYELVPLLLREAELVRSRIAAT